MYFSTVPRYFLSLVVMSVSLSLFGGLVPLASADPLLDSLTALQRTSEENHAYFRNIRLSLMDPTTKKEFRSYFSNEDTGGIGHEDDLASSADFKIQTILTLQRSEMFWRILQELSTELNCQYAEELQTARANTLDPGDSKEAKGKLSGGQLQDKWKVIVAHLQHELTGKVYESLNTLMKALVALETIQKNLTGSTSSGASEDLEEGKEQKSTRVLIQEAYKIVKTMADWTDTPHEVRTFLNYAHDPGFASAFERLSQFELLKNRFHEFGDLLSIYEAFQRIIDPDLTAMMTDSWSDSLIVRSIFKEIETNYKLNRNLSRKFKTNRNSLYLNKEQQTQVTSKFTQGFHQSLKTALMAQAKKERNRRDKERKGKKSKEAAPTESGNASVAGFAPLASANPVLDSLKALQKTSEENQALFRNIRLDLLEKDEFLSYYSNGTVDVCEHRKTRCADCSTFKPQLILEIQRSDLFWSVLRELSTELNGQYAEEWNQAYSDGKATEESKNVNHRLEDRLRSSTERLQNRWNVTIAHLQHELTGKIYESLVSLQSAFAKIESIEKNTSEDQKGQNSSALLEDARGLVRYLADWMLKPKEAKPFIEGLHDPKFSEAFKKLSQFKILMIRMDEFRGLLSVYEAFQRIIDPDLTAMMTDSQLDSLSINSAYRTIYDHYQTRLKASAKDNSLYLDEDLQARAVSKLSQNLRDSLAKVLKTQAKKERNRRERVRKAEAQKRKVEEAGRGDADSATSNTASSTGNKGANGVGNTTESSGLYEGNSEENSIDDAINELAKDTSKDAPTGPPAPEAARIPVENKSPTYQTGNRPSPSIKNRNTDIVAAGNSRGRIQLSGTPAQVYIAARNAGAFQVSQRALEDFIGIIGGIVVSGRKKTHYQIPNLKAPKDGKLHFLSRKIDTVHPSHKHFKGGTLKGLFGRDLEEAGFFDVIEVEEGRYRFP